MRFTVHAGGRGREAIRRRVKTRIIRGAASASAAAATAALAGSARLDVSVGPWSAAVLCGVVVVVVVVARTNACVSACTAKQVVFLFLFLIIFFLFYLPPPPPLYYLRDRPYVGPTHTRARKRIRVVCARVHRVNRIRHASDF